MGSQPHIQSAWVKVNKALLQSALHHRKKVTLDIDATEIVADKADAQGIYNKNKGFMPMVGHSAETGPVVAVDFRVGNIPPARDKLAFIKQCQQSLPADCSLSARRISDSRLSIVHWYNQDDSYLGISRKNTEHYGSKCGLHGRSLKRRLFEEIPGKNNEIGPSKMTNGALNMHSGTVFN